VVQVPTYEEMLAWAKAKDKDIAARKIYGLGGLLAEVGRGITWAVKESGSVVRGGMDGMVVRGVGTMECHDGFVI
jgi:hypothetical protein